MAKTKKQLLQSRQQQQQQAVNDLLPTTIINSQPIIINNYFPSIAPWPSYKLRNMFQHLSSREIEEIMKDSEKDEAIMKLMTQTGYLSSIQNEITAASKKEVKKTKEDTRKEDLAKENIKKQGLPIAQKTIVSPPPSPKERLSLDNALQQIKNQPDAAYAGWSEARVRAFKMIEKNPNSYYYRFNAPGESQRKGKWTEDETKLFFNRLKEVGANAQWGIFSMAIPGRVGYQCSNYYRFLIESGDIVDPCYVVDSNGKARYLFDKKTVSGEVIKEFRTHTKHKSSPIVKKKKKEEDPTFNPKKK